MEVMAKHFGFLDTVYNSLASVSYPRNNEGAEYAIHRSGTCMVKVRHL